MLFLGIISWKGVSCFNGAVCFSDGGDFGGGGKGFRKKLDDGEGTPTPTMGNLVQTNIASPKV